MDNNHILLDTLIEFPTQFLLEGDGLSEGSLLLHTDNVNQGPISNQTMVELGKRLLQAASENDIENVRLLMTGGAPFTGNWLGTTPLHAAAKAGHIDTVELLLKAGIFRDAKTKVDRTALQMAAEEGHNAIVEMLIQHGADINAKDMLKMTALHWAAERGHKETVATLLQHGASVTIVNKFDKTPLDIACDNGFNDILHLLEVAANQNVCNEVLAENDAASEKLMDELAADKQNHWNTTPDEDVLETLTANASSSNSSDAVKLLESHGITMLPADNSTVLTSALESGQTISLTEAGKLALNQTKFSTVGSSKPPVKRIKSSVSGRSPRMITLTADQFLALAGELQNHGQSKTSLVLSLPKNVPIGSQTKTPNVVAKSTLTNGKSINTVNDFNQCNSGINRQLKVSNNPSDKPEHVEFINEVVWPVSSLDVPTNFQVSNPCTVQDMKLSHSNVASLSKISVNKSSLNNIQPHRTSRQTNSNGVSKELKGTLPRGSARTTPIALLCNKKKNSLPVPSSSSENSLNTSHYPSNSVLTLNSRLLPEECESQNGNAVWLSIMEDDSEHVTENDEDLLDPTCLAAQLASIRQAASQFSLNN